MNFVVTVTVILRTGVKQRSPCECKNLRYGRVAEEENRIPDKDKRFLSGQKNSIFRVTEK